MLDPITRSLLSGAGLRGPIALMYHSVRVGRAVPDWTWAVSQRRFEEQMDLLQQHGWTSCPASDLVASATLPDKTIAITFDDGYLDNYRPLEWLARRGMRATLFMVSDDVGGHASWPGEVGSGSPMLDAGQLRELQAAGIEIGSHTRRHARLTEVADPGELRDQVSGSRAALQDLLQAPIDSFAYPYGAYDARVRDAVAEAGYRVACVTRSGWGWVANDSLQTRRIAVFAEDGLAAFARKLAFADNHVDWPRVAGYYLDRLRSRVAA